MNKCKHVYVRDKDNTEFICKKCGHVLTKEEKQKELKEFFEQYEKEENNE